MKEKYFQIYNLIIADFHLEIDEIVHLSFSLKNISKGRC